VDRLANFVNAELRRISFFLQYAGVIEEHIPTKKTQKILMDLPVDWDDKFVLINNKKPSDTTDEDYFYGQGIRDQKLPKDIQLKGKLGDRPFIFKIKYGDNRHTYYVDFEDGESFGHKKPILNISGVREILDTLGKGEQHTVKELDSVYKATFKNKDQKAKMKDDLVSKFFGDYKQLDWQIKTWYDKEKGLIRLQLFTDKATPEEYKTIFKLFTVDDPERSKFKVTDLLKNSVSNFVGNKMKDAGFDVDVSVSGVIKPESDRKGNLSGTLGFTITIK
jgi:hypothetical protein